MSITTDIVTLIQAQPGILTPQIAEQLGCENPLGLLAKYIKAGAIRTERRQAPNGKWVTAFYPGDDQVQQAADAPAPKPPRAYKRDTSEGLVAALYTSGELVIERGGKSMRLTPDETRQLVMYLDRVNVDQIVSTGITRHVAE